MNIRENFGLFLKGAAMGAANVIPGVSGGTIAFITNIYERLIKSIKSFDLSIISLMLKGAFKEIAKKTDLPFLLVVLAGVFISILTLAKVLEFVFVQYEVLTLAFFFGLVLASILAVGREIEEWNAVTVAALLLGTAIAVSIAFFPPAEANESFFYVFICGVVAICSMILPGLSGSYILLLMGNYLLVLRAISSLNFSILIPLGLGCIIGLLLFSRLLSYLFDRYKDATIAMLTGFVAGSIILIWPWKVTAFQDFDGKSKAVGYEWQIPTIDGNFFIALLLIIVGYITVYLIEKLASSRHE